MGLMLNPVGIDVEPRWGSCHEVGCVPGVRCATPGYVVGPLRGDPPSAFAKLVKLIAYAEGVSHQSLGSRSAPQVTLVTRRPTPSGLHIDFLRDGLNPDWNSCHVVPCVPGGALRDPGLCCWTASR